MHPKSTAEDVAAYIKAHNTKIIVGVDEAGRGTWAGPICAAAAAIPTSWKPPPDIRDSKKLSRDQMYTIFERYRDHDKIAIGLGLVLSSEIDEIGIDKAQAKAQGQAIKGVLTQLDHKPFVVVDGINTPAIDFASVEKIMLVPKADALIPAVSLASIYAKVTQIDNMRAFDAAYPDYGFAKHCGYGTKEHKTALMRLGPCQVHRRSYKPVRDASASVDIPETRKAIVSALENGETDLDALLEELMDETD
jgi:ribonuclease HII